MPGNVVMHTSESIKPIHYISLHNTLLRDLVLLFIQKKLRLKLDFESIATSSEMIVSETLFSPDTLIINCKLLLPSYIIVCRNGLID
jgi:hypothetical protein